MIGAAVWPDGFTAIADGMGDALRDALAALRDGGQPLDGQGQDDWAEAEFHLTAAVEHARWSGNPLLRQRTEQADAVVSHVGTAREYARRAGAAAAVDGLLGVAQHYRDSAHGHGGE